MPESILGTVRPLCGIYDGDDSFDVELVVYINAAIGTLEQLGVTPKGSNLCITDITDTWNSVFGVDTDTKIIKQYVQLKSKQMFDPATSTTITATIKESIEILEWRLREQFDT